MSKLIAISLNPNIQPDDIVQSLKAVWSVFFSTRKKQNLMEHTVAASLGDDFQAVSFLNGRTGWYALLQALEIKPGDEVLVPAFTCVAVINPIRWLGAKPVYVDITDDYNIDLNDASTKVSSKSRILLAQHTFGRPADIAACEAFCQQHNMILIEDCAHSIGARFNGEPVGTRGLAAFFSFGRDKCVSAGSGGMVATRDKTIYKQLLSVHDTVSAPSHLYVTRQILYVWGVEFLYILYAIHPAIGKGWHRFLQRIGITQTANSPAEKRGELDERVLHQWHDALAVMSWRQWQKRDRFVQHRRALARYYHESLQHLEEQGYLQRPVWGENEAWLRYTIRIDHAVKLRQATAQDGIVLGEWYDQVVGPNQVDLSKIGYETGSCPQAEKICAKVVNLPTSPRINHHDAERIVRTVKSFFGSMQNGKL